MGGYSCTLSEFSLVGPFRGLGAGVQLSRRVSEQYRGQNPPNWWRNGTTTRVSQGSPETQKPEEEV